MASRKSWPRAMSTSMLLKFCLQQKQCAKLVRGFTVARNSPQWGQTVPVTRNDPAWPLTDEQVAHLQDRVEQLNSFFLGAIETGRKMTASQVAELAGHW